LSPEQLEAALNSLSPWFENRNTKGDKEIASHKLGGDDNRKNEMRAHILITKKEQESLIGRYHEYMKKYVQEHTGTKIS
jgi:hypothetical protein